MVVSLLSMYRMLIIDAPLRQRCRSITFRSFMKRKTHLCSTKILLYIEREILLVNQRPEFLKKGLFKKVMRLKIIIPDNQHDLLIKKFRSP
jgi:hypothetical protein